MFPLKNGNGEKKKKKKDHFFQRSSKQKYIVVAVLYRKGVPRVRFWLTNGISNNNVNSYYVGETRDMELNNMGATIQYSQSLM